MDKDEFYYQAVGQAAHKKRNLDRDELNWAKENNVLDYYKDAHWDEQGRVKKKSFWNW